MPGRTVVLDANILVRAVLGRRVREVIAEYAEDVSFLVPDVAVAEAEEHLPALMIRHGGSAQTALAVLHALVRLFEVIGRDDYGEFEAEARERLDRRDPDDWPVLAVALAFDCPIWTEDADFFGCGVATWTSGNVKTFLRGGQR